MPEETKKVLDAKPELVNCRASSSGLTALQFAAARSGDRGATAITYLLDRGADPNIQANNGFTALYEAAASGNVECVRLLLAAGADPTIPIFSGKIAIEIAEANHHHQIVGMLESASAPSRRAPNVATGTTASTNKAGCFVATVCYTSYSHPAVLELRWFRDHCMIRSLLRRSLASIYYIVSPPIAAFLKSRPVLAKVTRTCLLAPIVYSISRAHHRSRP
jgi:hypothetical protein